MLYQPLNLTNFRKVSFYDVKVGDTCNLHNGKEAVYVKITEKIEKRELLKGEVLFYLIFGNTWTKGDDLIFSPNNISSKGYYAKMSQM